MGRLLVDSNARGNLVTDAHLAALAIEHGTGICSLRRRFRPVQGAPLDKPQP